MLVNLDMSCRSRGGGGDGVKNPVDFPEYGFCNDITLSDPINLFAYSDR